MAQTYQLGSLGWNAFMHGQVAKRLEALGEEAKDLNWSICEVYTDPPASLSPDGSPIAWSIVIRNGVLEFSSEDRADVELRVVADYEGIVPIARFDARGDPERSAELGRMVQVLTSKGGLTFQGDRSKRDPRLGNIHDTIARVTA